MEIEPSKFITMNILYIDRQPFMRLFIKSSAVGYRTNVIDLPLTTTSLSRIAMESTDILWKHYNAMPR